MQTRPDGIARRIDLNLMTPAELAIRQAMVVVGGAGCHPLLTEAVDLLSQAHGKVADFVELGREQPKVAVPPPGATPASSAGKVRRGNAEDHPDDPDPPGFRPPLVDPI